jgi:hypothetical protein
MHPDRLENVLQALFAIAHQLDEAAPVPVHERFENVLVPSLERSQRLRLICAHEAAIADDIGNKNRCDPALHALDT